jgi:hypothetical protein
VTLAPGLGGQHPGRALALVEAFSLALRAGVTGMADRVVARLTGPPPVPGRP